MNEQFRADAPGLLAGLAAGSRIAGYCLEQQIGPGGMAVVFRAVDERLGRRVALKGLAPALASDQAFRQRFIRESQAATALGDPHIIPVCETGEAGAVLFIAMRYVAGADVRTLLHHQGRLSPERAAAIISPVASALDAAHAAGLVHRDVKPANILVDTGPGRPDHVYLSDFGLSKGALSAGLTGTGQYLGTPDYMAPEQIEGRAVDGRTDQYALACSAFELLAGDPPFRRDQGMAVLLAHLQQAPPSLASRLPAAADLVFSQALAKAPADRYASCREFADALRQALDLPPITLVPTPAHSRSARPPRLHGSTAPAPRRRPSLLIPQPPATGRPGQAQPRRTGCASVTLTGASLGSPPAGQATSPGGQPTLDGVPVPVTSWSASAITFTLPAPAPPAAARRGRPLNPCSSPSWRGDSRATRWPSRSPRPLRDHPTWTGWLALRARAKAPAPASPQV